MKRYCIDCGSPTEYSFKKPVFCSNCGKSFEKAVQAPQILAQVKRLDIVKKTYIPQIDINEDNDPSYEEDIIHIPKISKIQVETEAESSNRGIKIKDLMGTSENKERNKTRFKSKKLSKKEILEDFAKEAGSIRKSKNKK